MNPPVENKRALYLLTIAVVLCSLATSLQAAPNFPALSGRVVDTANLLSGSMKQKLTQQLQAYEDKTTNQVVVVTLNSLQGYDIADYGYQLGRHWGIGQAGHNNGVLLIVAPKERKVRIEVGYGLEGTLTDALSRQIIDYEIIPRFKQNDYSGGIEAGTAAILGVLGGSYDASSIKKERVDKEDRFGLFFIIVGITIVLGEILAMFLGPLVSTGSVFWCRHLVGWLGGDGVSGGGCRLCFSFICPFIGNWWRWLWWSSLWRWRLLRRLQ